MSTLRRKLCLAGCLGSIASPLSCAATNDGFDWALIGNPNNPAYDGESTNGYPSNRGSVAYEYRISRVELTAGQWLEFVNTFAPLGDPFGLGHQSEGGGIERGTGSQWILAGGTDAANRPMSRLSWRACAMYCNWLHNDKAPTLAALQTGAYDTSTWGENPPGSLQRYNDAATRLPGARYWIPSVDEWIKAVHYDPDKNGTAQGGYWLYPDSSDTAPLPGRSPLTGGDGQTNAEYANFDASDWRSYRVGAYPDVQSPWGLLDASGGVAEWLEDWADDPGFETYRRWDGSSNGFLGASSALDRVYRGGGERPNVFETRVGLRIASAVPSPSPLTCSLALGASYLLRRRRAPACG